MYIIVLNIVPDFSIDFLHITETNFIHANSCYVPLMFASIVTRAHLEILVGHVHYIDCSAFVDSDLLQMDCPCLRMKGSDSAVIGPSVDFDEIAIPFCLGLSAAWSESFRHSSI